MIDVMRIVCIEPRTDTRIEIDSIDVVPRGISVMRPCAPAADVHNIAHARRKRGTPHLMAVRSVLRTRLNNEIDHFFF